MDRARFRLFRIAALLLLLAAVGVYALADIRSRRARNAWTRPLDVAIVLLEDEPVDPDAIAALRARIPELEAQLGRERARYLPGAPAPFRFEVLGPANVSHAAPSVTEPGVLPLVRYTWDMRRYVAAVDDFLGVDTSHFDSRIYATIRPPWQGRTTRVEGQSEQGGRIGQVRVELVAAMADLALIVITHELLHTLGATDKYAADGTTPIPAGLADPAQTPLLPQARVEVMARNRPIAPGKEVVPSSLAELGVGPLTAGEIRWSAAP